MDLFHNFQFATIISSLLKGAALFWNEGTGKCVLINTKQRLNMEIIATPCSKEAAEYVLCCHSVIKVSCPASYLLCEGECLADSFDCEESRKQIMCEAHFVTSAEYCLTECHIDNCTCHSLYFQCPSGGCLHTARICDGQDDCLYGEDEALCGRIKDRQFGHISLGYLKHDSLPNVGKFLLNQSSSSEEMHLIRRLRTDAFDDLCMPAVELPCTGGYLKCYPVDKQCVYDRTCERSLKYCANGGHLIGCTSQSDVQCSGTFKCYQSYCITVHLVCDGTLDCPYGDDESECPIEYCHHMLHCGGICVHPNEICDGINQCKNGEDELQCGAPVCPDNCECLGYSVLCQDAESILRGPTSLGQIKMLTLKHSWQGYSLRNLFTLSHLLILDLSHSEKRITEEGELVGFPNLCVLLLSNNSFDYVVEGFFQNAVSLRELDLSWNPITHLNEFSLGGLNFLRHLSLRHCHLKTVSIYTFSEISILSLDLSENQLDIFGVYCVQGNVHHIQFLNLSTNIIGNINHFKEDCVKVLLSDQEGLCCLEKLKGFCVSNRKGEKCAALLSSPLFVYGCTVTALITFSNVGAIIYNLHLSDLQAALSALLALANLLITVPLCSLITWHSKYGKEFVYHGHFLQGDLQCKLTHTTLFLSTEISVSIWLLISGYKWYGISTMKIALTSTAKMSCRIFPVVVCLVWFSATFPFTSPPDGLSPDINECIFGSTGNTLLLLFGVINIISCLILLAFYTAVLGVVRSSNLMVNGRKHGYDTFKALSVRVCFTMIVSAFCILPPSIIMICASIWGVSVHYRSTLIAVFPLQATLYPFIHTFSTPKFLRAVRNIRESKVIRAFNKQY